MKSYKQFLSYLIESRVEELKKKYSDLSTSHDSYAEHKQGSDIVSHFAEKADPTPNKKHTQWILNQYKKGNIKQEDYPRIHDTLKNFDRHKSKLVNKDLNSYKHIADVDKAIEPHLGTKSNRETVKDIKHEGAEKIHDENGVQVHKLKTKEAACAYGKNTKWCTAATNNNMFDRYNKQGPLYHVKAKDENGKFAKYQFHHETNSYMDDQDQSIHLKELVKRNPELRNVKEFQGKHPTLTRDFDKHFENFLKNNAHDALSDPRIKKEHLEKALSDWNMDVRRVAARHSNATKEHLDKALSDSDWTVRSAAASNPNATKEHLDKALSDSDWTVRSAAASNPNATKEHLDKALSDSKYDVRLAAAKHPSATKEHLDKALSDSKYDVRLAAAKHPSATKEHLDKALSDSNYDVRLAVVRHSNATKEHLDKALSDSDWTVRSAAASNPSATKEHLDKALNNKYFDVRRAAASNPSATKEHLDKAISDEHPFVRYAAAKNPNATKEHLDKALSDSKYDVRHIAKSRLNAINKK